MDSSSDNEGPGNKGYLKDKIAVVESGDKFCLKKLPETVSFDKGLFLTFKATQMLKKVNGESSVTIIGIAGASGSGKTFFATKLATLLEITTISLDNYMLRDDVVDDNFDDPRLVDFDLLNKNLDDLAQRLPTEMPIYSFAESRRAGYKKIEAGAGGIIVIEGIHALNARLRDKLDIAVSVSGGVHNDLIKRVLRDIGRVGQSGSEVLNQISETVYPMYKAFIEPDLQHAHYTVQNYFNPFDGFLSPTYILKSSKTPSPELVASVCGEPRDDVTATYTDIYLHPPGTEPHDASTNWIRVRENNKKYNLMFSEWLQDGNFIISPRITFEVSVKVLGGLMALGYQIGFVVKRGSREMKYGNIVVTLDQIAGESFVQIKGPTRDEVSALGEKLGLEGSYDPRSYIEMIKVQMVEASDPNELEAVLAKMRNVNLCSLAPTSTPSKTQFSNDTSQIESLRRELQVERAARATLQSRLSQLEQLVQTQETMHSKLDSILNLLQKK